MELKLIEEENNLDNILNYNKLLDLIISKEKEENIIEFIKNNKDNIKISIYNYRIIRKLLEKDMIDVLKYILEFFNINKDIFNSMVYFDNITLKSLNFICELFDLKNIYPKLLKLIIEEDNVDKLKSLLKLMKKNNIIEEELINNIIINSCINNKTEIPSIVEYLIKKCKIKITNKKLLDIIIKNNNFKLYNFLTKSKIDDEEKNNNIDKIIVYLISDINNFKKYIKYIIEKDFTNSINTIKKIGEKLIQQILNSNIDIEIIKFISKFIKKNKKDNKTGEEVYNMFIRVYKIYIYLKIEK